MVKIHDKGLATFLSWDLGGKQRTEFTEEELQKTTEIQWSDWGIGEAEPKLFKRVASLAQIEALPNLKMLIIQGNDVSHPGTVSALKQLEELWLLDNALTTVDGISGMPKLKKLHLSNNRIKDLSGLTDLPALNDIDVSMCPIEDYSPLLDLPALTNVRVDIKPDNEDAISVMVALRQKNVRVDAGRDTHRVIEDELAKLVTIDENDPVAKRLADLDLPTIAAMWMRGPTATDEKLQNVLHLLIDLPEERLGEERGDILIELTQQMLDVGVDPHQRRAELYNETPLTLAIRKTHQRTEQLIPLQVISLLAEAQRDWAIPYRYGNPLAIALEALPKSKDAYRTWLEGCVDILSHYDDALIHGTAFSMMCKNGDAERVQRAIAKGADVNGIDCTDTPLTAAVEANQREVVELLLDNGADINGHSYDIGTSTPAHAVRSAEMFTLLSERGANFLARDGLGRLPLAEVASRMWAVDEPVPLLQCLVEAGNDIASVAAKLIEFVAEGRDEKAPAIADFLESSGYLVDFNQMTGNRTLFEQVGPRMSADTKKDLTKRFKDPYGLKAAKTETHFKQLYKTLDGKKAVFEPGTITWQAAIKLLANSNAGQDKKGEVEKALSALRDRVDSVVPGLLTEKGDDVSITLTELPASDYLRVVQMLWLTGVDARDDGHNTALHYLASDVGNIEYQQRPAWESIDATTKADIIKRMISAGAPTDVYNLAGDSPAALACQHNGVLLKLEDLELVESLCHETVVGDPRGPLDKLLFNLQPNDENAAWQTRLAEKLVELGAPHTSLNFVALCRAGLADLVQNALDAGASPNAKGIENATPLAAAAMNGRVAVVELLLKSGANPNQRLETHDANPLVVSRYPNVTALLLKHGADATFRSPRNDGQTAAHAISANMGWVPEGADTVATLKLLYEAGADFEIADARGATVMDNLRTALENNPPDGLAEFVSSLG